GLLDPDPSPDERILPRNYGRGPGSVLVNLRLSRAFAFGPSTERNDAAWTGPGSGAGRRDSAGAFGAGVPGAASTLVKRRFSLNIWLAFRIRLNHTTPGPIMGNITSPGFGQANRRAGNLGGRVFSEGANTRRLELKTRLPF